MSNFYTNNKDLEFIFENMDLEFIVELMENYFQESEEVNHFDSYSEALEYYKASLELLGKICGEQIAPRRSLIDQEGSKLIDGEVKYAEASNLARELLSNAGYMGAILPRKYGGAHLPASIYMMMIEIVSRADASLMTMFGYQDVGELISRFGTNSQCKKYLPKLASGEHIGAIVLSEPGAGSDLQSIKLKACQTSNGKWLLNGTKHFISNGCGDVLMVLARSEPDVDNIFGLSAFICPKSDNVSVVRVEEKMGLHGSPTCELFFCDAPAELLGKRKFGLTKYILESLTQARFSVAAQSLGIAQEAYSMAKQYSFERKQFGKLINEFPAVSELLIDMQASLESCRALLYFGAKWLDRKTQLEGFLTNKNDGVINKKEQRQLFREAQQKTNLLSPLIKYYVTEAANWICNNAQQIFGGMGYMKETGIEQLVRDVRITTIYEGTTQVQVSASLKLVMANVLETDLSSLISSLKTSKNISSENINAVTSFKNRFEEVIKVIKMEFDEYNQGKNARIITDAYVKILASLLMLEQCDLANDRDVKYRKKLIASRIIFDCEKQLALLAVVLKHKNESTIEDVKNLIVER